MLTKKSQFFLLGLILTILVACKTAYIPNTVNVPLFDDAGEMRLSGDLKGNFQVAASISPSIGLMLNGMIRQDGKSGDVLYGKGNFFEAGVGSFSNTFQHLRYEVYGGVGIGNLRTEDNGQYFETKGTRVFFQPTIGYHHSVFEVAFTPRLAAGKYQSPSTDFSRDKLIAENLFDIDKHTWIFIEPALTFRLGYQFVKLQVQLGRSFKLSNSPLAHEKNMSSVGLIFDIGRNWY